METTATVSSLLRGTVTPEVITPNGDLVNDVATISYDLLEIIAATAVRVEICDLSGRIVREVYAGNDQVGHYDRIWDGRDDSGKAVPPGTYLYRIDAGSDKDRTSMLGVINVAF